MRLHALYINKRNRKDELLPLFAVCVQLHWFACLPAQAPVLITRGFILCTLTLYRNNLSSLFLLLLLVCWCCCWLVCCLLCHTFFAKVDDTLSLWPKPITHTIQTVYQISLGRHLSRMQCLTVYKSTRFACEIKKSYLILLWDKMV